MSCGCENPWNNGALPSTNSVCGEFTKPTNPDQGRCSPAAYPKTDCEAPTIPQNPCNDPYVYASISPEGISVIFAGLFDQDCLIILDQDNLPILTII